jgi:hypothetical protein
MSADSQQPAWRGALVVVAALLIPILPFAVIGELPGERCLSANDAKAWRFALAGVLHLLMTGDVLLPVPSSIIGSLMGRRLGFLAGLPSIWLGLMLGNLIGYGVGRLLLGHFGERLPQAPTLWLLFLSRPVPVLAAAATFTAGAERIPPIGFGAVCGLGNLIYAAVLAGNGAALLPQGLAGPGLVLPMLLPVVAWTSWRWLRRRATSS